jgi:hypothetical protein
MEEMMTRGASKQRLTLPVSIDQRTSVLRISSFLVAIDIALNIQGPTAPPVAMTTVLALHQHLHLPSPLKPAAEPISLINLVVQDP